MTSMLSMEYYLSRNPAAWSSTKVYFAKIPPVTDTVPEDTTGPAATRYRGQQTKDGHNVSFLYSIRIPSMLLDEAH
jgi:hypothetical protein